MKSMCKFPERAHGFACAAALVLTLCPVLWAKQTGRTLQCCCAVREEFGAKQSCCTAAVTHCDGRSHPIIHFFKWSRIDVWVGSISSQPSAKFEKYHVLKCLSSTWLTANHRKNAETFHSGKAWVAMTVKKIHEGVLQYIIQVLDLFCSLMRGFAWSSVSSVGDKLLAF